MFKHQHDLSCKYSNGVNCRVGLLQIVEMLCMLLMYVWRSFPWLEEEEDPNLYCLQVGANQSSIQVG